MLRKVLGFFALSFLITVNSQAAPPPPAPLLLPTMTTALTPQQVKRSNAATDWSAMTLRAIWANGTTPPQASRVIAMVHVSMFDAANAILPTYSFYPIPGLTSKPLSNSSPDAAVIASSYTILNSLYPAMKPSFDVQYQTSLAALPDGPRKTNGIAWGQTVANAMLTWRSTDHSTDVVPDPAAPPGGLPGVYELTPRVGLRVPSGTELPALPTLAPQWGGVTPWAMSNADQFLPGPPPTLDSAAYTAAFNEVKSIGATNSTTRTADQEQFAQFWADAPGFSVTPPGHWIEIAVNISLQRNLNLLQTVRTLALIGIAVADAGINCWRAKNFYNFWRPITAIRDARANEINSATTSDPTWVPLWNTPNFQSYTSGHSSFSAASSVILTRLFGSNFQFQAGSDDMPGLTRSFTSFANAANEAADSRVVGGIHFRFDNDAGLNSGRALGEFIVNNFLLPWQ